MAETAGLRPRPSQQVFAQVALRGVVLVFAFCVLIAAAVAVGTLNDFFGRSNSSSLFRDTRGVSGWLIFLAIATMVIMGAFIILRCVNNNKTVMVVEVVLSTLLSMGYFAGGVAAAVYADDWDAVAFISQDARIRDSLAAAAAFSFFSVIALIVLVLWSVYSLRRM